MIWLLSNSLTVEALLNKTLQFSGRRWFVIYIDFLLGLLLLSFLPGSGVLTYRLCSSFEKFITWLESLIVWLMGSPVGLKLNKPLNAMIGQFFLYHIYLWRTYITFLNPVISYFLLIVKFCCLLSFKVVVSLVHDFCWAFIIHVYCFYVYAARLYRLHVVSLLAFSRLFRGRKYNPLRERIDSCSFDSEQLFFGTLVFTILLFLLPTVLTYYVVFACFRIATYVFQNFLRKLASGAEVLTASADAELTLNYSVFSRALWIADKLLKGIII